MQNRLTDTDLNDKNAYDKLKLYLNSIEFTPEYSYVQNSLEKLLNLGNQFKGNRPSQLLRVIDFFQQLMENQNGMTKSVLEMATGTGKTNTFLLIVCLLVAKEQTAPNTSKAKALIIVPTSMLNEQSISRFNAIIPEYTKVLGLSAISIANPKSNIEKANIVVTCEKTISKTTSKARQRILAWLNDAQTKTAIFDEAQLTLREKTLRQLHDDTVGGIDIVIASSATASYPCGRSLSTYNELQIEKLENQIPPLHLNQAISLGILTPIVGSRLELPITKFDARSVKTTHSKDFEEKTLNNIISKSDFVDAITDVLFNGENRYGRRFLGQKTIIHCSSIEHANKLCSHLNRIFNDHIRSHPTLKVSEGLIHFAQGYHSKMGSANLKSIKDDFENGRSLILAGVMTLSQGVDFPDVDVVVLNRPSKMCGLLLQQIGRGIRRFKNKEYCDVISVQYFDSQLQIEDIPEFNKSMDIEAPQNPQHTPSLTGTIVGLKKGPYVLSTTNQGRAERITNNIEQHVKQHSSGNTYYTIHAYESMCNALALISEGVTSIIDPYQLKKNRYSGKKRKLSEIDDSSSTSSTNSIPPNTILFAARVTMRRVVDLIRLLNEAKNNIEDNGDTSMIDALNTSAASVKDELEESCSLTDEELSQSPDIKGIKGALKLFASYRSNKEEILQLIQPSSEQMELMRIQSLNNKDDIINALKSSIAKQYVNGITQSLAKIEDFKLANACKQNRSLLSQIYQSFDKHFTHNDEFRHALMEVGNIVLHPSHTGIFTTLTQWADSGFAAESLDHSLQPKLLIQFCTNFQLLYIYQQLNKQGCLNHTIKTTNDLTQLIHAVRLDNYSEGALSALTDSIQGLRGKLILSDADLFSSELKTLTSTHANLVINLIQCIRTDAKIKPWEIAIKTACPEVITGIMNNNNINEKSGEKERTPLMLSVIYKCFKYLLPLNPDPNLTSSPNENWTAMMFMVKYCSAEELSSVFTSLNNIDLNLQSVTGQTALMIAIQLQDQDYLNKVEMLLNYVSNEALYHCSQDNLNAFELAITLKRSECLSLLLRKDSSRMNDKFGLNQDQTLAMLAAKNDTGALKVLISANCNLQIANSNGSTALDFAALNSESARLIKESLLSTSQKRKASQLESTPASPLAASSLGPFHNVSDTEQIDDFLFVSSSHVIASPNKKLHR